MAIAENLAKLMADHNMRPIELAADLCRAGQPVTEATVDNWLAGANMPRVEAVIAIANRFGVTTDDLLRENVIVGAIEVPDGPR